MKNPTVIHQIAPVYDENARILILGSFPSVKSREEGFFYGHKQNRFWRVLAAVYGEALARTVPEKKALLHRHGIALWDVIASCEIDGSADSSIKNAVPNDITEILNTAQIRLVLTNGKTADALYRRYLEPLTKIKAVCLPSTSPANAAWRLDKLTAEWKKQLLSK